MLWHHADFVKLVAAQTISLMGSSLTTMALPLIAAITLNATPAEMGILAALGTLPSILVGLAAGVWVDRYRRRAFLIAGDLGRAALLATIPVAALAGALSIYQLYAVSFLGGMLTVIFNVANRSYLPAILEPGQLVDGNSKLELSTSVTTVAGPSLAGLVIQAITAPFAVALDSLSFLVSALLVFLIRKPEGTPSTAAAPMMAQVREGLAIVFGNPSLRAFSGCLATSNLMSNIFFSLYMLFGTRDLALNAAELGIVYGIGASGALFGALAAPWAARRLGVGRAIIGGALLGSAEVLPAVVATPQSAVPLLLLSSMLGNFGWVVFNVNETSVRQAVTPAELQGRMHATFLFIVSGALPLGALAGGALGQLLGVREAIAISALGSLLAPLWVVLSPVRQVVAIPGEQARPT